MRPGLTTRATDAQPAYQAFRWLTHVAPLEWVQLCALDLFRSMRAKGQMKALTQLIAQDAQLQESVDHESTVRCWQRKAGGDPNNNSAA
jgi:hypothetical protein